MTAFSVLALPVCPATAHQAPTDDVPARHALAKNDPLDEARRLMAGYNLPDAYRQVEAALAEQRTASALSAKARIYSMRLRERPDEAIRLADEALALDLTFQEAVATKARALAILGRAEEALETAGRALALGEDDPWAMNAYARALIAAGLQDEAEAFSLRVLELDPGNLTARKNLALIYRRVPERQQQAIDYMTEALDLALSRVHFLWQRAQAYTDAGQIDRALADYAEANEISPNDQALWFDHASLLFKQERYEEMNAVIDAGAPAGNASRLYCMRAEAFEKRGEIETALEWYQNAADADPEDYFPHYQMAYVYRDELRDYRRCIAAWDQAIERSDNPADCMWRRGLAHRHFGRNQEALDDFVAILEIDEDNITALATIAEMVPDEQAMDIYLHLVEIDPDDAHWPGHVAVLYYRAGRLRDTVAWYTRSLEIDPDYFFARRNRAQAYDALGMHEEAVADSTYILEHCEDRAYIVRAYFDRGNAYLTARDPARASADFEESIRLGNRMPAARYNLGLSYQQQARWDDAVTAYSAAIRMYPRYASALGNRAICNLHAGNDQGALEDIDAAIALSPQARPWELWVRAKALYGLGRLEDALNTTDQALQLDRNSEQVWSLRIAIFLGLGRQDDADQAAQARSRLGDRDFACYDIASCYLAVRQDDRAERWVRTVLDRGTRRPGPAYRFLTLLELCRGDLDAAAAHAERFLEHQPDHVDAYVYNAAIAQARGNPERAQELVAAGRDVDNSPDQCGHGVLEVMAGVSDPREVVDRYTIPAQHAEAATFVGYWLCVTDHKEEGLALLREAVACPEPLPWEGATAERLLERLQGE